jgi:hypothetical protein
MSSLSFVVQVRTAVGCVYDRRQITGWIGARKTNAVSRAVSFVRETPDHLPRQARDKEAGS